MEHANAGDAVSELLIAVATDVLAGLFAAAALAVIRRIVAACAPTPAV
jgi:hypothetical protein